jgi:hypothetical protein
VLSENAKRLLSPSDVHVTLLHAALGLPPLPDSSYRGNPGSFAQTHGVSLLFPVSPRDCGEPPFTLDVCPCGWTDLCRADRILGTREAEFPDPETVVGGTEQTSFRHAVSAYIGRQLDGLAAAAAAPTKPGGTDGLGSIHTAHGDGTSSDRTNGLENAVVARAGLPCLAPTPAELVVVKCPTPGMLFDVNGRAPFELLLHSNQRFVYVATGYLEMGAITIESVWLAHRDGTMWDACLRAAGTVGYDMGKLDLALLRPLCACES